MVSMVQVVKELLMEVHTPLRGRPVASYHQHPSNDCIDLVLLSNKNTCSHGTEYVIAIAIHVCLNAQCTMYDYTTEVTLITGLIQTHSQYVVYTATCIQQ